jgi:branched-chain amino acid transport system substrate-binding protein
VIGISCLEKKGAVPDKVENGYIYMTKNAKRIIAIVALSLTGVATLLPAKAADANPINIGIVMPLTGSLGLLGKETLNGMEVARTMINAAGGVKGRKIVYKISDAPTAADATTVAGSLSTDDSIAVIMGSYSSSIAIPASAVASRNKKLFWEAGGASPVITNRGLPYVYRTLVNVGMPAYTSATGYLMDTIIPTALKKKVKDVRYGLVYEDGAYGTSGNTAFKAIIAAGGYNLVASESYSAASSDLSSVIQKLKSANIDVLVSYPAGADAILFTRQSKTLGFNPKLTIGQGAAYSSVDFGAALGSYADGILVADAVALNPSSAKLSAAMSPSYPRFIAAYTKQIGRKPLTHATLGYVGAMTLFQEVLAKSTPGDLDSMVEAIKKIDIPDGGTVATWGIKFDSTGQNTRAGWYIMQYQGGKLVSVYPNTYSTGSIRKVIAK